MKWNPINIAQFPIIFLADCINLEFLFWRNTNQKLNLAISTKPIGLLERCQGIKESVWFGAREQEAQVRSTVGRWAAASTRGLWAP